MTMKVRAVTVPSPFLGMNANCSGPSLGIKIVKNFRKKAFSITFDKVGRSEMGLYSVALPSQRFGIGITLADLRISGKTPDVRLSTHI